MNTDTLTPELLQHIDAYWRAANYLSVGQIYLYDNPLLKRPLALADVKHMLLGHWGTTPGQNFIYAHLNRVIKKYDLDMIYISGPGHGGPADGRPISSKVTSRGRCIKPWPRRSTRRWSRSKRSNRTPAPRAFPSARAGR